MGGLKIIRDMDKEILVGIMDKHTKESGLKVLKMDQESGNLEEVIAILDSG